MDRDRQQKLWGFSQKVILNHWIHHMPRRYFLSISVFIRDMDRVLLLYFIMRTFGDIGGWSFYEALLCQAYMAVGYGIVLVFFTGLRDFDGKLDKYLLKPTGVLTQILLENTDWFAVVAHISRGVALMTVGIVGSGLRLSWLQVLFLFVNLAGSVLIMVTMWLVVSTLQFVCGLSFQWRFVLNAFPFNMIHYPLLWFPGVFRVIFTYVFPVGFMSYYPVLQLLGRTEGTPWILQYLAFPVGLFVYAVAYGFWRWGIRFGRNL